MKITEIPHPGGRYIRSGHEQVIRDASATYWREMRKEHGSVKTRRMWRRNKNHAREIIRQLFYTMPETVSPFGQWLLANEDDDANRD